MKVCFSTLIFRLLGTPSLYFWCVQIFFMIFSLFLFSFTLCPFHLRFVMIMCISVSGCPLINGYFQVSRSSSVPPNMRDTLYQGLPPSIKNALRSKLHSFKVEEEVKLYYGFIQFNRKRILALNPSADNSCTDQKWDGKNSKMASSYCQ